MSAKSQRIIFLVAGAALGLTTLFAFGAASTTGSAAPKITTVTTRDSRVIEVSPNRVFVERIIVQTNHPVDFGNVDIFSDGEIPVSGFNFSGTEAAVVPYGVRFDGLSIRATTESAERGNDALVRVTVIHR